MNTSSSPKGGTTSFSDATSVTSNYPANARELPKRTSPLAKDWVASGHYYDEASGLVKPYQIAS